VVDLDHKVSVFGSFKSQFIYFKVSNVLGRHHYHVTLT